MNASVGSLAQRLLVGAAFAGVIAPLARYLNPPTPIRTPEELQKAGYR